MTQVVNLKTYVGSKDSVIYIGRFHRRWGRSIWGNPYKLGEDGTREEVLEQYRGYLKQNYKLMDALPALKKQVQAGKVLGCWCKPEDCHGDVLLEVIEKLDYSIQEEKDLFWETYNKQTKMMQKGA